MENEKKQLVDLYIPRKCMATNKIIGCDDHGSIQMSIPKARPIPGLIHARSMLRARSARRRTSS